MSVEQILNEFYQSFASGDAQGMVKFYGEHVEFSDPVFGPLKGDRAAAMWKMLLSRRDESTQISYKILETTENTGKVNWKAEYNYGPKKRRVINHIHSNITIRNGKIVRHIDHFDIWKWSRQALGTPGYLLGWSGFMRNKIRNTVNHMLDKYMSQNG